jgi:hypothetical protein
VRSLDGSGSQSRGASLAASPTKENPLIRNFTLTNTVASAATDPALHPQDATAFLNQDIYRLSVSVEGKGWSAQLKNALAAVKFGESTTVPVYLSVARGTTGPATVTLKAKSESDPAETAKSTMVVASPPR